VNLEEGDDHDVAPRVPASGGRRHLGPNDLAYDMGQTMTADRSARRARTMKPEFLIGRMSVEGCSREQGFDCSLAGTAAPPKSNPQPFGLPVG